MATNTSDRDWRSCRRCNRHFEVKDNGVTVHADGRVECNGIMRPSCDRIARSRGVVVRAPATPPPNPEGDCS